jgi:hypothetical protein
MLAAALIAVGALRCGDDGEKVKDQISSRAYKGHESDVDANNFVTAFPAALGTRLDDCQTCHKGATLTEKDGKMASVFKNACDYCHLITHPSTDYKEAMPKTYTETLNPFGKDYSQAGRSLDALESIADKDSDGDGSSNKEEIEDLKYPGDEKSKPGQKTAPMVTLTIDDLGKLKRHKQFLLSNSHKQQFDDYAYYEGVRVTTLLEAAGVDVNDKEIQGVTVIAPDGYLKDFTVEEITRTFPAGLYYAGLDNATLGTECGFVKYPDKLPADIKLTSGEAIPGDQVLMLADLRDGLAMDPCNLDVTSGRINGEGPLRIVVPQSAPGKPDRGSNYSPTTCNDGYDYDDSKDHNAGAMVRGVVAIRVNPLPAGYEDFDHINGGWAYIDSKSVIVYGHGVKAK